jgi:hypothetical protein
MTDRRGIGWHRQPDGTEVRQVSTPEGLEVWLRRPQSCSWAQGPVLTFSVREWDAFVVAVKNGDYNTVAD